MMRALSPEQVVIVGGGQAGGRCAEALRAAGFAGRVTIVGKEVHLPYERPSLSKEMLISDEDESIAWVRPEQAYAEERIELRLGVTATSINRDRRAGAAVDRPRRRQRPTPSHPHHRGQPRAA